jgi:hypothetical protein
MQRPDWEPGLDPLNSYLQALVGDGAISSTAIAHEFTYAFSTVPRAGGRVWNRRRDFLIVLPVNRFAAKPAATAPPNPQETLLREIRDALVRRQ